ncbi:hypothetical protein C0992_012621 [Termitomyces sp. T32_za158]|nr:hypothetical protein C0992_012621 [Termitomyces sp. T32_za158]
MASTVEPGQFDDAEDDGNVRNEDPRAHYTFIDTVGYDSEDLEWPEDSDPDEDEIDEYDNNRVEDEDWEIAERGVLSNTDFTKHYNRLRQHVAVRTGNAQGASSSIKNSESVAALPAINHPKSNTASTSVPGHPKDRTADQLASLAKFNARIAKIDTPYIIGVGINRKGPSAHANLKDKADRATTEQVLDPRTRIILFKMIGRGLIHEINGCISTGKEANVYHALTPENTHLALKIYKTSILIFKDRDKYVTGEFRFRRGYNRHNPRKMVRLWAEKEMRNLRRLVSAGIHCPDPIEVRENVLVMSFVGDKEGWASPRLKDAELPIDKCADLYVELVLIARRMFHQWHLCIIDVSQSVEHDHPAAFDFLRKDIKNVEGFFGRLGVRCLGLRRCFEFITQVQVSGNDDQAEDEAVLRSWIEKTEDSDPSLDNGNSDDRCPKPSSVHEDSVFMQSFIPRTLNEVYDPERDVEKLARGEGDGLIYAKTIGVVNDATSIPLEEDLIEQTSSNPGENGSGSSEDSHVEDDNDLNGRSNEEFEERKPRGHRHEDRDAKKERKQAVKAEARERRKHKMPKAEKKRNMKKSKG